MRRLIVATAAGFLLLLLGSGGVALAQEEVPEPPTVQEAIPPPMSERPPVRPAPPAGAFGVWMGPMASPDEPLPKGFEPLYLKQEWSAVLGDDPVVAFSLIGPRLITVAGKRDAKTRVCDFSSLSYQTRTRAAAGAGFGEPLDLPRKVQTGDGDSVPVVSSVVLPGEHGGTLFTHRTESGNTQWMVPPATTPDGMPVVSPERKSPFFPLVVLDEPRKPRVLALRDARLIIAEYERDSDDPAAAFAETKTLPITPRVPPVSAACVGEFAGDRKQVVAVLGSVENGPAAFIGLRSKSSLPDTEEEFAPGIIAAWRVPGRPLPFLVTVRNIGAEEGTDFPEGRVLLSLWNGGAGRWMGVWESPPLGKKIIAVATAAAGGSTGGMTQLVVLCEEANGSARLVALSAMSPAKTP